MEKVSVEVRKNGLACCNRSIRQQWRLTMALNRSRKLLDVTVRYARELRKKPTKSERLLWRKLRGRRLNGWRFMRQRPILIELHGVGTFAVADFYCAAAKLVVEIDGSVHRQKKVEDEERDQALARRGYSVMRIEASDVENSLEQVLVLIDAEVRRKLQSTKPHVPITSPLLLL
jgi:very-short-patch-repair endonuclease